MTNLNSWSAHADVVSQLGDVATAGNYCIFEVSLSGGTSHVVESSRTTWTRSNDSIVEAANVQARVRPRAAQGTCRLSCMAHAQKLHRLSTQSLYTDSLHRRSKFPHVAKQPRTRTGGATRDLSLCGVRPLRPPAVKKGTQQALVPFAAAATVPLVVNHVHVSHESE